MRLSWVDRRYTFYAILIVLLLIHLGSLLLNLKMPSLTEVAKDSHPKAMKVNIVKIPLTSTKRQIVQSEDSQVREKKDNAFLSDKDRSFERETRAKKVDIFKSAAKSNGGGTPKRAPTKNLKLSDLSSQEPHPMEVAAKEYSKAKNGTGDSSSVARHVSSTNDYVEDIPLGDMTHLNTTEYKYYGFYHRIRQRLEQFWGRSIEEKAQQLLKLGRQVSSSDSLITSLEITLNHIGEIIAIRIIGTSGVQELDDAAVESFNDAGPFPNPPKGLVQNGQVVIEWGFVVNT